MAITAWQRDGIAHEQGGSKVGNPRLRGTMAHSYRATVKMPTAVQNVDQAALRMVPAHMGVSSQQGRELEHGEIFF